MNTTYLIDLENVNSSGFEGAENLTDTDELIVFYSEKADTLKIPIITSLLGTSAQIKFYKCKNGIMNAMDFDIVSVLGIVYNSERDFVIVSKDKGFDVVVERYRSFGKGNVQRRAIIGAKAPITRSEPEQGEVIDYSAPAVPEIEPDTFEQMISKGMEEPPLKQLPQEDQASQEPESSAEPEAKEKKKAQPKKKKASKTAEMSRLDKGKINQFLNNLMGAKHEQPMTKDELKLIRETAESVRTKNAFYNALRKKLGNEKGIALYNRVKDEYDDIAKYIKEIKG
ncbi:MAG: hypothetical protein IJ740_14565 [Ruminococcus sp.]|nr:hypothetical protein [Ruminococcus sp.]